MRLLEVTLPVLDLEEMRKFYVGILGMRQVEPGSTGRLAVQAGNTRLYFTPVPTPNAEEWRGRYHFAFDVPSDRFDAALSWLKQRVPPVANLEGQTHFHSDNWNSDSVYFYDTQGNILELIARYDKPPGAATARTPADDELRRLTGRPFNASEIEAVTEVGLAVGSVVDAVAQLTERIPGLEVYKGPGSNEFTPVGDVEGLLIVVHHGRIWFPETGVAAVPQPLDLLIEMNDGNRSQQRYRLVAPPYPFQISITQ